MFFTKVLETRNSKYNKDVKVIRALGWGTYIQSGGLTQSGGIVESIWKSTLKFINRKSLIINHVLILGLGGGSVAKVLRKKYPNAKITGVEIDPMMIELGKKYLDLDKYDVDVKIMDARKFSLKKYDLVIIDGYLGDNYVDFFNNDLKKSKLIIFNKLFYKDKKTEALEFGEKLKKKFKHVEYFYPPANLMFFCGQS